MMNEGQAHDKVAAHPRGGRRRAPPATTRRRRVVKYIDHQRQDVQFSSSRALVTNSQSRDIEFTGGNPRTTVRREFGVVPRIGVDVEHAFRAKTCQDLTHGMLLL